MGNYLYPKSNNNHDTKPVEYNKARWLKSTFRTWILARARIEITEQTQRQHQLEQE